MSSFVQRELHVVLDSMESETDVHIATSKATFGLELTEEQLPVILHFGNFVLMRSKALSVDAGDGAVLKYARRVWLKLQIFFAYLIRI